MSSFGLPSAASASFSSSGPHSRSSIYERVHTLKLNIKKTTPQDIATEVRQRRKNIKGFLMLVHNDEIFGDTQTLEQILREMGFLEYVIETKSLDIQVFPSATHHMMTSSEVRFTDQLIAFARNQSRRETVKLKQKSPTKGDCYPIKFKNEPCVLIDSDSGGF